MKYKAFGERSLPTIILLHGGGLSWWSLEAVAEQLKCQYHVVTPILDGHGEDGETLFVSIEEAASKVISAIDADYGGKVFAIGGLSIGAQITVEILSRRGEIAEYAIIESALVYPIKGADTIIAPTMKLCYGLIKQRWYAKIQGKSLFIPQQLFEQYYEDSMKMTKESLVNMTVSNGTYKLKETLSHTKAKVLVIVGEKELGIMKKSANTIHEMIPDSKIYSAVNMGHGQLSVANPQMYVKIVKNLFANAMR